MRKTNYTFLLPAFKSSYLEEALLSIKQQTFTDFVCIVSDDCSPEDLKSIYDEVVGNDSRFTYRRNTENMGGKSLVSHWNLLVDMCETEYLIMASDDDVYDLRFLEEVDKLAEKYPEVDLIRARARAINRDNQTTDMDIIRGEFESQLLFLHNYPSEIRCLPNYVFKTSVLKKEGGFIEYSYGWASDDVAVLCLCRNGVAITKSVLFSFRNSGLNITSIEDDRIMVRKKAEARKLFLLFLKEYDKTIKTNTVLEENWKNGFSETMHNCQMNSIRHGLWAHSLTSVWKNIAFLHHAGMGNLSLLITIYLWFKQYLGFKNSL